MRTGTGLPPASPGAKTNWRAACTAASSYSAPADCATSTLTTLPVSSTSMVRMTLTWRRSASGAGGSAATKRSSRGGLSSAGAGAVDVAGGAWANAGAAAMPTTTASASFTRA